MYAVQELAEREHLFSQEHLFNLQDSNCGSHLPRLSLFSHTLYAHMGTQVYTHTHRSYKVSVSDVLTSLSIFTLKTNIISILKRKHAIISLVRSSPNAKIFNLKILRKKMPFVSTENPAVWYNNES